MKSLKGKVYKDYIKGNLKHVVNETEGCVYWQYSNDTFLHCTIKDNFLANHEEVEKQKDVVLTYGGSYITPLQAYVYIQSTSKEDALPLIEVKFTKKDGSRRIMSFYHIGNIADNYLNLVVLELKDESLQYRKIKLDKIDYIIIDNVKYLIKN